MKFTKMHGIGNDYIYVNGFSETVDNPENVSKLVSDRHFGIGGDGLVLILPSEIADVRMRMFNADGSEGAMCGNAIRCVAKYAYESGLCRKNEINVETMSGIKNIIPVIDGRTVTGARVNMGAPVLYPRDIPMNYDGQRFINQKVTVSGREYNATAVSMGNPHWIFFTDGIDSLDLPEIGPAFENHELFPNRVNTEFVEVKDGYVRMRVWERGSGETLACGTGACAVLTAAVLNHLSPRKSIVKLRGGELLIEWNESDNNVYMTGSATKVFDGEIDLKEAFDVLR